jgi:hypothetical protein
VHPTLDYLASAEIQKAARDALFGPKTRLMPGGWSFHDRALLSKLAISPPVVTSGDVATTYATTFMTEANERWARTQSDSALFPLDRGRFRLVRTEVTQIVEGRRPLAWRVSWLVTANCGPSVRLPAGVEDRYAPVDGAVISLVVSLTGRIVGGSATWRPTQAPLAVEQRAFPDEIHEALTEARATAAASPSADDDGEAHGHDHDAPSPAALPPPEMRVSAAARAEYCRFLDPRLHFIPLEHGHTPPLVVPMTDYGISVQILTEASRGSGQRGRVMAHAWVVNHAGAVPMSPPAEGYAAHWTVLDPTLGPDAVPDKIEGGAPLALTGLKHVALTVTNAKGAIAHAHAEVCSFLDAPRTRGLV